MRNKTFVYIPKLDRYGCNLHPYIQVRRQAKKPLTDNNLQKMVATCAFFTTFALLKIQNDAY